ncbi:hypothetical protein G4B84_001021 [Aspergillus flavus NRRL3357]|nr:uncharacterized protein G4B84_001021 [Aspergillus flavus NRRL3357]QMW25776.1 hypothetical protein G4B84_001021 [Aspergillus flavus NRRL3357]QMW37859.1 hypothetical protein G4B11_001095 [Aspergillus flavus]
MPFWPLHRATKEEIVHNDDFLQGSAATYIDMMYSSWKNDPSSVHLSWQAYFHNVENGHIPMDQAFMPPPGLVTASTRTSIAPSSREDSSTVKQLKVIQLIQAYQRWGHEHASTDPLGMANEGKIRRKELQLSRYGLSEQDLDLVLTVGTGSVQDFTSEKPKLLWEVIAACEKTYCSTMGIEYNISNQEQVDWIRARIEGAQRHRFTDEEKRRMLHGLVRATSWEKFVATKFPNEKRFGLDGVESYIPALETAIDRSAEHGVDKTEMGVAHRGRMNMLYNIVGKDGASMFRDFDPKGTSSWGIPGDIKYHYGGSGERVTPSGKKVYMNVLPQPSHLDSVNPVAMGKTRGIQDRLADERESTMMLNVHTDASFAAQGTIYETLGLSGRLHDGYVAKMLDAPVFHVNGDDVEAVCSAAILAADFRTRFKKDCVVDIVCYRRNGHNEVDQASFTQPTMYERIANKAHILGRYETGLIEQGIITREQVEAMKNDAWDKLMQCLGKSDDHTPDVHEWLIDSWKSVRSPMELERETLPQKLTAIDHQAVETVSQKLGSAVPEGFVPHKNLERILARRKQTVDSGKNIDWATAEALAFGNTIAGGHDFLHDQQSNKTYTPLSTLGEGQGLFSITNSSLTENTAMGFEYGYSLADPNALVIWEAQFGDFANNAQCIIDNYIASSEEKWLQRSGVVLSLPHGYDGQGPEHTSARLERFLQLGNEDSRSFPSPEQLKRQYQDCNIQVVCMTSPANYFHVLRRQVHREFRKRMSSSSLTIVSYGRALIESST